MKILVLLLALLVSPAYSMDWTNYLIMESQIKNQLQQQQNLYNFEQSLKMQSMQSELEALKRQQQVERDELEQYLRILRNRQLLGVE